MPLNARLTRVLREVRRWRGQGADDPIAVDPDLEPSDLRRLSAEIEAAIGNRGGLAAARRRARTIGLTYATLSPLGRERFFDHLATAHDRDRSTVDRAIEAVAEAPDPDARHAAEDELRAVLRPGREGLLRRLGSQPGGLDFLVKLRADLLPHRRRTAQLSSLDAEFRHLLETWFDVGLLELVRLTWDTPACLLERLIEYEAVHAIESWDDLKRRLGPGRRCYAFLHPGMPDDPLIFVEVALTEGIPDQLGPLIEPIEGGDGRDAGPTNAAWPTEGRADTAVFYSISNCHRGLAGVSLGDFLIKSVAEELSAELTGLKTFVTLSPLPGFRSWLIETIAAGDDREAGPIDLASLVAQAPGSGAGGPISEAAIWRRLGELVEAGPRAPGDDEMEELRPVVSHLAARYITATRPDGRAVDPVAHFHLSNGARIERLNWMANPSPTGWDRGLGMMVNYRYNLRTIEDNHERYVGSGELTVGDEVQAVLEPRSGDGRRRWR